MILLLKLIKYILFRNSFWERPDFSFTVSEPLSELQILIISEISNEKILVFMPHKKPRKTSKTNSKK
jgi:hypothetical protein